METYETIRVVHHIKRMCGECYYYVHYEDDYGYCHYNPPTVVMDSNGIPRGAFPPVKVDEIGCDLRRIEVTNEVTDRRENATGR